MHESEKWKWSRSVVSDSSRPHGPQPTRLPRPWDFPGESTAVGAIVYRISKSSGESTSACTNLLLFLGKCAKTEMWIENERTLHCKYSNLNIWRKRLLSETLVWNNSVEITFSPQQYLYMPPKFKKTLTCKCDSSVAFWCNMGSSMEKAKATHSSVLAWRIPGMGSLVGCRPWGRTESDTTEET